MDCLTTTPFEALRQWLTMNVFKTDESMFLKYAIETTFEDGSHQIVEETTKLIPLNLGEIEWFDKYDDNPDLCRVKSINNAENENYVFEILELKKAMKRVLSGPLIVNSDYPCHVDAPCEISKEI